MTFEEVLTQAIAMLQRLGRVSYRALKVQSQLDDDLLALLTDEIVAVHQLARDQEGKMLVWTGDAAAGPRLPLTPEQAHAPLTYTPPHLACYQKGRGEQAWALYLLGSIALQSDPPEVEPAETSFRHAITLAEAPGMRPLQAHCHRGLGMLYAQRGEEEQAHTELSTAITMYRTMDMTFWLPQTQAALAQVARR